MTIHIFFILSGAILIAALAVLIRKLLLIQAQISEIQRPTSDELLRIFLHIKDSNKGNPKKQIKLFIEWEKDVREHIKIEEDNKKVLLFKQRKCSDPKIIDLWG
ncbi:hypothetical protein [Thalassomonas sp. RHCl1]|uniref:hypothetical protein n=1 Tax=Thalassomonas sp. RHCl1 TaxID=2995320 RepID=UPI00248AFDAA|nr:hypothetical protein [Thalassomonas sp. RHCl1]